MNVVFLFHLVCASEHFGSSVACAQVVFGAVSANLVTTLGSKWNTGFVCSLVIPAVRQKRDPV